MSNRSVRCLTAVALTLMLSAPATAQRAQASADVLILSPEPGERIEAEDVLVAVSFPGLAGAALSPGGVRAELGGRDITLESEIRGDVLTWRPRQPLPPGPHRVVITLLDADGRGGAPVAWTFTVTPASARGPSRQGATEPGRLGGPGGGIGLARMQGSIVVEGAGNSASGEGAALRRAEDFVPRMWLNAGGTIAPGWRYATRIHASGYEQADQQPVNRYSFELRAPFFSVAAGDVHPVMQDLILAGRRVRGGQAELRGGPVRLSAVAGQSRRAVPALLDPLDPASVARTGTYGQDLFAVRPSIGRGDRFQLGLTALRVRDDVASIPALRTITAAGGVTRSANLQPKDNLVAGLDLTLRMAQGRLLVRYENGFSLLANDITGGPLSAAGLDSILTSTGNAPWNVDPSAYERFFIINSSMIPLDPRGLTNVAHQLRTTVRAGSHMLSLELRSVGGSYHTLGAPSLQRDRRGVRIRDSFTLLNDALIVSAGAERDEDNLDDVKPATTTSTGGFVTASWQASPSAVLLTGAARLGSRSNTLRRGEVGATNERNLLLSAGASVPVPLLPGLRTRLSLNGSLLERADPSNRIGDTRDVYLLGGVQAENAIRSTEFALMLGTNRTELTGVPGGTSDFQRVIATGRHRVAPRLAALLDGNYVAARSPEAAAALGMHYDRLELLGGGEFEWASAAVLSLTGGVVSYQDQRFSGLDSREILVRLRMSRAF
jgi:hypothetical protein